MINLLSNAIKFTERGSIRVHGSVVDGNAEIRVTDTGVGIAAEDQVKLFRPFQQVGRWPTRRSDGVGLGLAISRRLIELQRGHVWMESAAGAGSSFGFTLPMAPIPALS
jgi:signal transduction histidine kinase